MTDQSQRTEWALQQFAGFVESWAPAAMPPQMQTDIAHVRDVIAAIAPVTATNVVGYARQPCEHWEFQDDGW